MSNLVEEAESILQKLEEEAGSEAYWTEAEIKSWYNDLYVETCREAKFLAKTVEDTSVAGKDDYDLPDKTIHVVHVTYDNKPIYPTTIMELDSKSRTWRSLGNSIPYWWYFAEGEEYTKIRLYRTPNADGKVIAITVNYIPERLEDDESPKYPLLNSLVLQNGVIAIALWKAGPGRDVERGNYYWNLFQAGLYSLIGETKNKQDRAHVLRSIEDVGIVRGPRLPSNYPTYPSFD